MNEEATAYSRPPNVQKPDIEFSSLHLKPCSFVKPDYAFQITKDGRGPFYVEEVLLGDLLCALMNCLTPSWVLFKGIAHSEDATRHTLGNLNFAPWKGLPFESPNIVLVETVKDLQDVWSECHKKECKHDFRDWLPHGEWSLLFFRPTATLLFAKPRQQQQFCTTSLKARIRVDNSTEFIDDTKFCRKFREDSFAAFLCLDSRGISREMDTTAVYANITGREQSLPREDLHVEYKLLLNPEKWMLDSLRDESSDDWHQFLGLLNTGRAFKYIFGVSDKTRRVFGDSIRDFTSPDISLRELTKMLCELDSAAISPPLPHDCVKYEVGPPIEGTRPADWESVCCSKILLKTPEGMPLLSIPIHSNTGFPEVINHYHKAVELCEGRASLLECSKGRFRILADGACFEILVDGDVNVKKKKKKVLKWRMLEAEELEICHVERRRVLVLSVLPPRNTTFVCVNAILDSVKWLVNGGDGKPELRPFDGFSAWLRLQDPFQQSSEFFRDPSSQIVGFFEEDHVPWHEQTIPGVLWQKINFGGSMVDEYRGWLDHTLKVILFVEPSTLGYAEQFLGLCRPSLQEIGLCVCVPHDLLGLRGDDRLWLHDLRRVLSKRFAKVKLFCTLSPSPNFLNLLHDKEETLVRSAPRVVPVDAELSETERDMYAKQLFHDVRWVSDDAIWWKMISNRVVATTKRRRKLLTDLKSRLRRGDDFIPICGVIKGLGVTSTLRLFAYRLAEQPAEFAVYWFKKSPPNPALFLFALKENAGSAKHIVVFADSEQAKEASDLFRNAYVKVTLVCPHTKHISSEARSGSAALVLCPFLEKGDLLKLQKPFLNSSKERAAIAGALEGGGKCKMDRHWFVIGLAVTCGHFRSAATILEEMWSKCDSAASRSQLEVLAFLSGFASSVFPVISRDAVDPDLLLQMEDYFKVYQSHVRSKDRVCFRIHPYFARRLLFQHILPGSGDCCVAPEPLAVEDIKPFDFKSPSKMPLDNPEKIIHLWKAVFSEKSPVVTFSHALKKALFRRYFGEKLPRILMPFLQADRDVSTHESLDKMLMPFLQADRDVSTHESLDKMLIRSGIIGLSDEMVHQQIAMSRLQRFRMNFFVDPKRNWFDDRRKVAVAERGKTKMLKWAGTALENDTESRLVENNYAVSIVHAAMVEMQLSNDVDVPRLQRALATLTKLYGAEAKGKQREHVLLMNASAARLATELLQGMCEAVDEHGVGLEGQLDQWKKRSEPEVECQWWKLLHEDMTEEEAVMMDDSAFNREE